MSLIELACGHLVATATSGNSLSVLWCDATGEGQSSSGLVFLHHFADKFAMATSGWEERTQGMAGSAAHHFPWLPGCSHCALADRSLEGSLLIMVFCMCLCVCVCVCSLCLLCICVCVHVSVCLSYVSMYVFIPLALVLQNADIHYMKTYITKLFSDIHMHVRHMCIHKHTTTSNKFLSKREMGAEHVENLASLTMPTAATKVNVKISCVCFLMSVTSLGNS